MKTDHRRQSCLQRRVGVCVGLWVTLGALCVWSGDETSPAPATAGSPQSLIVRGLTGKTTTITPEDFAKLPRTTITAPVPHSDQKATYEGVLLERVLEAAHVQPGDVEKGTVLARPYRSAYVLIEAADGYQVVFSIPEVFANLGGQGVLLVDRQDGAPLTAKSAPYRIVVEHGTVYERWIRQVTRILVLPAAPPAEGDRPQAIGDRR